MVYRDIQMLADDSPAGAARAAIAADLAAHWGGRLRGLFLKTRFPPDMLSAEGMGLHARRRDPGHDGRAGPK